MLKGGLVEGLRGMKKGVLSAGHLYYPFQGKYLGGVTHLSPIWVKVCKILCKNHEHLRWCGSLTEVF